MLRSNLRIITVTIYGTLVCILITVAGTNTIDTGKQFLTHWTRISLSTGVWDFSYVIADNDSA